MSKEKSELDVLMDDISKKMGEGVATVASKVPRFIHIPTGCFLLDYAMAGGYAEGCGHMVYGMEGSSKTTLCHIACARLQEKYPDGHIAWIDTEKKFDPEWAKKLGMDLERTVVIKPRTGEHAVDVIEAMARAMQVKGIVLDSIPSLAPMKIITKSAEDPTVAERARLVGLLCSKLQQAWIDEAMRGHRFTFWCVNQFREKVGGFMMGDTRTLPGGRFQNYMVDTKLEMKCKEEMKNLDGQERHVANNHVFKFTKTKGAFSIKSGEFVMVMDDTGREDRLQTGDFDDFKTVVTFAKRRGFVTGGGSTWRLAGSDEKYNTLEAVANQLRDNEQDDKRIRRLLIMAQRCDSKLPALPRDNYLYGTVSRKEVSELVKLMTEAGYGQVQD